MAKKKRKIIDIWNQIKFKYKLSLQNENTSEEIFSFRLSQLTAFFIALFISLLLIMLVVLVIVNTSLRSYLPGYLDTDLRSEVIDLRLKLDSLMYENDKREVYMGNVRSILSGELRYDSIAPLDSMQTLPIDSLLYKSERERNFCAAFEDGEKYNLTVLTTAVPLDGLLFFAPVKGCIERAYDYREKRYGVDILCSPLANVCSPLDGTVIFAGYTPDNGYVVQVQHTNEYVSVFRRLSKPVVLINQSIRAGAAIANPYVSGDADGKLVVNFELWHRGTPLNPEEYINF